MGYGWYMEGHYDKELEWQQVKDDSLQADKIRIEAEKLKKETRDQLIADELGDEEIPEGDEEAINEIFNKYGENKDEYLVDGAYLTCNMADFEIKEILKVRCGHRIHENPENMKGTVLHVFGETEIINKGMAATVKDHTLNRNIEPLKCNCRNLPDRISEIQKFYENIDLCQQYGTCQVLMRLERDWENIIRSNSYAEYNYTDDGKEIKGAKAITMKSMLFCSHGGIITPVTSGQVREIIFSEFEEELYIKFYDNIAYENWSDDKKECAEAIWNRFYVEYGYDAAFVAGLIGNMYVEGVFGQLQGGMEWHKYSQELKGYMIISTLSQAKIACFKAPSGFGIGAIQWSFPSRKIFLYQHYEKQAVDGRLSPEQLKEAELQTLYDELNDSYCYERVIIPYNDKKDTNTISDNLTLATCIILYEYEVSGSWDDVDNENGYEIRESVKVEAKNVETYKNLPSIYRRVLAAKAAYEALK